MTLLVQFSNIENDTFGEKCHKSVPKVSFHLPLLVRSVTKVSQTCHMHIPLLVKNGTKVSRKCHLHIPLLVKIVTKCPKNVICINHFG